MKSQIQRCRHNGSCLQCSHSAHCCRYVHWPHTHPGLAETDRQHSKHIHQGVCVNMSCVCVCGWKPRHSVLVAVVWNPAGHWQMYDPGVFTHSPWAHGFLSHSSSSGNQTKAHKRSSPTKISRKSLLPLSETYQCTLLVHQAWSPCCTRSDNQPQA